MLTKVYTDKEPELKFMFECSPEALRLIATRLEQKRTTAMPGQKIEYELAPGVSIYWDGAVGYSEYLKRVNTE